MQIPHNWQATAFNQSTQSANQIHSDEIARVYGFKGGLVPGVTVSSYLMHPAVVAWGERWLKRGRAHVLVKKPLYDGYRFDVELSDVTHGSYRAGLVDQNQTECASARVSLNEEVLVPPIRRGDPVMRRDQDVPPGRSATPVTRAQMEKLREKGMSAFAAKWSEATNMSTYLKDPSAMPALLNFDGSGYANGAFMLALSNWVLAANAYMNPWIHLQTESQNYDAVENNTDLIVESRITDLFERKGHEFVDVDVDVYRKKNSHAVMSVTLRAIYRMRGVASPATTL